MSKGPLLVIRGTILGSLFVIVLCLLSTAHIQTAPVAAVAYAASPTQTILNQPTSDQSTSNDICQVSSSYSQDILQWCETITSIATQYGLSPDLIAAVILQESGGNASAYSHSGAVGLMQVMPRDGIAASFECPNGPCFASRPTIEELQDPEFNIQYGTRMLAGLLGRYGNLREALRAYGPMNSGYSYADKVLAIYENYR
jgi:soluble lytic murein transglycosylase-like protein